MTDASNMPARIWADLNSPAWSRSLDAVSGFDSAMPYYRADIVERMAEALWWYASDEAWTVEQIEGSHGDYGTRARTALTSYCEAINDQA